MRYLILFFILISTTIFAQTKINGLVTDIDSSIPVAFAKVVHQNQVVYTNWEGKFQLKVSDISKPITVLYKGYYENVNYLSKDKNNIHIKLISDNTLKELEVYSENEVNKIIKNVVNFKKQNCPEKRFDNFAYKNYEFLHISANPDSISSKIDTLIKKRFLRKPKVKIDSTNYKFKKLVEKHHIYQTEKVNQIEFNKNNSKETILATRMAGFENPLYEYLGLELVSYSVYDNPLEILEIPVQNPLSNYGRKLYVFKLIDTVTIDNRKVYQIYFQPKKSKSNRLRGLLYVDAQNYAISKAFYKIYGVVNINATYNFTFNKEDNIWLPKKRRFIVEKGNNTEDLKILGGTIKFTSALESENQNISDKVYLSLESYPYDFDKNKPNFKKDGIQILVPKDNLKKPESFWNTIQTDTLDYRKSYAYCSLDSISIAEKIEHKLFLGKKMINGYFPIQFFDLDLRSLIKYNNFEGFRFGIGGVTNTKLSNQYKIAFYGAYGLKDEQFKFSIAPSYLLNNETNTWISASYIDDLSEIAQTSFATDSRRFKIYDPRPFNISTFYHHQTATTSIATKILPKIELDASLTRSEIEPLFNYTYTIDSNFYQNFTISSAQISMLWSPFSQYMKTPTDRIEYKKSHPKFSFQYTKSFSNVLGSDFDFSKIDFKTFYEIPYLSGQKSSFLFQGGLALGNAPLTHLYSIVPNNLNKEAILQRITFSSKNSFETMYFNEFFSDKYFSIQLKHTFNKIKLGYKFNPEFSIVSRMALGSMDKVENHIGLPFKTLEKGFFESGIECNKMIKGFGLVAFYRYGPNQLAHFEDNIALKISFNLDLGF